MRKDIDIPTSIDPIAHMIATVNGNSTETKRLDKGVYEIGHFSFDHVIPRGDIKNEYIHEVDGVFVGAYGVCDDYKQILENFPEIDNSERAFVISVTPVEKGNQSADGGWRWHKWGQYIGKHEITTEYLYDEPIVERVYCYHIYELN